MALDTDTRQIRYASLQRQKKFGGLDIELLQLSSSHDLQYEGVKAVTSGFDF
jgi:hypothetical protein